MFCSSLWLLIPVIIFMIAVFIFRSFYIRTARSLETLEGVAKSPIIQSLSNAVTGLTTIRALKVEGKFIKVIQFEII